MTRPRRLRGEDGVTLVELLTAMTLSAIVMASITGAIIKALQTERRQTAQITALNDAKLAFERTTRDIRGADPLRVAAADRIQLDVRDRARTLRTVSYERSGDGLVFVDAAGGRRTLVTGLAPTQTLFVFHLSDGSTVTGDPAVNAALVRSVTVRLRVEPPGAGLVADLENRVQLRNAKA